jgi:hypothetical protein
LPDAFRHRAEFSNQFLVAYQISRDHRLLQCASTRRPESLLWIPKNQTMALACPAIPGKIFSEV